MKGVIYEREIQLPGNDQWAGKIVRIRLTEELNGYLLIFASLDDRTHSEIVGCKKEVLGWWDLGSPWRERAVETAVDEARKAESGKVEE